MPCHFSLLINHFTVSPAALLLSQTLPGWFLKSEYDNQFLTLRVLVNYFTLYASVSHGNQVGMIVICNYISVSMVIIEFISTEDSECACCSKFYASTLQIIFKMLLRLDEERDWLAETREEGRCKRLAGKQGRSESGLWLQNWERSMEACLFMAARKRAGFGERP